MENLPVTEFVNYIYSDENEKKIVYVAVGSAHHMARNENGIKTIEDKFNQQYPLYIRDLHLKNPDHKLYIILIDPVLENPCFTVVNKQNNIQDKKLDADWILGEYQNIYENYNDNVVLMEFRNFVKYGENDFYNFDNTIDINHQLNTLNELAMVDKWFVNVMDYSGRNLYALASSFDKILGEDKDHIFYGLASRVDGGCYIDLTENSVYFASNRDKGYITAFSPYLYDREKLSEIYKNVENKNDTESKIIKQQIKIASERIINSFKNDVLTMYRRLIIYKKNFTEGKKNPEFYRTDCEFIETKYKINIRNNGELEKNIDEILFKVSRLLDDEFGYLTKFFNKNDMKDRYKTAKELEDPYKMYSEICRIVGEFN
jgi:hypothetical protein